MDTLFFAYLRTQGVDPLEHEVKEELDRVKKYMGKLKKMTEDQSGPLLPTDLAANMKLNVDAANRFINHALAPTSADAQQGEDKMEVDGEESERPKNKSSKKQKKSKSKTAKEQRGKGSQKRTVPEGRTSESKKTKK